MEWINIGPRNITGVIRALASHPHNQDILYAGADFGGVWKTLDGGLSWFPTMDGELNLNVGAVGICRSQPQVVYAAMREGVRGGRVYRSQDGGFTWLRLANVHSSECLSVAIHTSRWETVYVAGSSSLHKSVDGGVSWQINKVLVDGKSQHNSYGIFDGYIDDVKLDPDNPETTVYIAVRGRGVFKSVDGGKKWSRLGSSLTFDVLDDGGKSLTNVKLEGGFRTLLSIGEDHRLGRNGTQFIAAKVQGTILISRDGGDNWYALPGKDHGWDDQNFWDSCLAICPTDQDFIVAGGERIDFTLNASDDNPDWNPLSNYLHVDQQAIAFNLSNPDNFYFANDGFIGKSTHRGSVVTKVSDGLVAGQCFNAAISQTSSVVGCSTYHTGIIRTGRTVPQIWDYIGCCEGGLFEIDPQNEARMFISPWGSNTLLRSKKDGWEPLPVDHESLTSFYVVVIGINPLDPQRIYACSFFGRLHYSTNGGDTWQLVKNSDDTPLLIDGGEDRLDGGQCFAYAPFNEQYLYVGTRRGHLWRTTNSSTDSTGWQELTTPYPPVNYLISLISAISVHPSDPDTIFLAYGISGKSAVWRGKVNRDGTVVWNDISGLHSSTSLPRFSVNALIVDSGDVRPLKIYAATDVGVFMTINGGDSWEPLNNGLPNVRIIDMRLREFDRNLLVAAWGRGIYSMQLAASIDIRVIRKRFDVPHFGPYERRIYERPIYEDPTYLRIVEQINDIEERLAMGTAFIRPEERPELINGTREKLQIEIREEGKKKLDAQLREQQKNQFREQQKNQFREQQKNQFREQEEEGQT